MTTRIYTKTGDSGSTGLFGGQRVDKDHVRVAAYGTADELSAAIGVTISALGGAKPSGAVDRFTVDLLTSIQSTLFEVGAQLATPDPSKRTAGLADGDIEYLEKAIDVVEAELELLKTFILPGGCAVAASLHVARGVCRRAERACVTLMRDEVQIPQAPLVYLNRLSDLLFVLARRANKRAGVEDVPWRARP